MQVDNVLKQSKWLALLALSLFAFPEKLPGQGIMPVQFDAGASDAKLLIGHWRKNTTAYYRVEDEHLVFHADGTVDKWDAAVSGPYEGRSSRSGTSTGRWSVQGKLLNIDWGDKQSSRPFFFHEGKLVLPNIPKARQYWDRVKSPESLPASVPRRDSNALNPPATPPPRDALQKNRKEVAAFAQDVAKQWRAYQESAPEGSVRAAQKSADSGSAEAQFEMGLFNEFGFKSLRPDPGKAAEWYRKAANQGHVLAKEGLEDLSRSSAALSEFDAIKLDLRRVSRLQRRLSNDLDRMDELARDAIKNIRSGAEK